MLLAYLVLCALVAAVRGQSYQAPGSTAYSAAPSGAYAAAPAEDFTVYKGTDDHGFPADYEYTWHVDDNSANNQYSQRESRSGGTTEGSFSILLPDGRTQTVTYTVDGDSGYVAKVTYEGEAKYPAAGAKGGSAPAGQYGGASGGSGRYPSSSAARGGSASPAGRYGGASRGSSRSSSSGSSSGRFPVLRRGPPQAIIVTSAPRRTYGGGAVAQSAGSAPQQYSSPPATPTTSYRTSPRTSSAPAPAVPAPVAPAPPAPSSSGRQQGADLTDYEWGRRAARQLAPAAQTLAAAAAQTVAPESQQYNQQYPQQQGGYPGADQAGAASPRTEYTAAQQTAAQPASGYGSPKASSILKNLAAFTRYQGAPLSPSEDGAQSAASEKKPVYVWARSVPQDGATAAAADWPAEGYPSAQDYEWGQKHGR